ncbi:MAG TPA: ferrochelatase [Acetobacteraceae bacterium]|nr:ferrochelatase [Acetobacteraceae bacterium]
MQSKCVQGEQCRRLAVVLFNLGAPDQPSAVAPFLRNLFRDPAILRVPPPVRGLLARLIAGFRLRPAQANYTLLGGSSPLLDLTRAQASALQAALADWDVRCFIAMRYWHPFAEAAARAVRAWQPDQVVLLPLYPQYSTTTTGSSFADWHEAAATVGLAVATHAICCYATDPAFVAAVAALVRQAHADARSALPAEVPLRVLFSAHGLPESIVAAGDPYQWQVEQTVAAVLASWDEQGVDWAICYQSRATPQRWIAPSTIAEVERAARDKTAVLVVPIAFVSEHSETLVELDIEYRHLAERLGVPGYFRVPTPGVNVAFIAALAKAVGDAAAADPGVRSHPGARICPSRYRGCPCAPTAGPP